MPLIGSNLTSLVRRRRIERLPRATGAEGWEVLFENGVRRRFDTIIWATGYRSELGWIAIDGALNARGEAIHDRGVAAVSGLYWIGLPWLHTKGSGFLGFLGRDAEHLARAIARRG